MRRNSPGDAAAVIAAVSCRNNAVVLAALRDRIVRHGAFEWDPHRRAAKGRAGRVYVLAFGTSQWPSLLHDLLGIHEPILLEAVLLALAAGLDTGDDGIRAAGDVADGLWLSVRRRLRSHPPHASWHVALVRLAVRWPLCPADWLMDVVGLRAGPPGALALLQPGPS